MFSDRAANSLCRSRTRQAWPEDRPFRILSLDGGGIRGLYTAELLAQCQDILVKEGHLGDYFDLIAGTSTGGIIALGLGARLKVSEIVQFYRDDGREIFPSKGGGGLARLKMLLRSISQPKLDYSKLEKALKYRLTGLSLGDSCSRLLIPAFMMPETEVAVFKTDHHSDYKYDWKTPMWEVGRATSAAPAFFRGLEHKKSGKIFLDGGIWANNPAMLAIVEALSCYDLDVRQIEVLSIGTGNAPFVLGRAPIFGGLFQWREIIKGAMYLTTDNATSQSRLLLGPDRFIRLDPGARGAMIEMDCYDEAVEFLPSAARTTFSNNISSIRGFFDAPVVPREYHYSRKEKDTHDS